MLPFTEEQLQVIRNLEPLRKDLNSLQARIDSLEQAQFGLAAEDE